MVSGSTEKALRVWDPRTGSKNFKLKGHVGNVRAIALDPNGRLCLSGSSDNLIRLWDLGQQRCVQTFAVHTDSVWALTTDASFNTVYSGGRDCKVYVTDLHTRESQLLFQESHPVNKLALEPESLGGGVWAATPDCSLRKWFGRSAVEPGEATSSRGARRFVAGSSPFARQRVSLDLPTPTPAQNSPAVTIAGCPGIVRHAIMNNRLHVLTMDSAEHIALWDITRGEVAAEYGRVNFEAKEQELMEQ
eukprot:gene20586-24678_t